MYVKDDTDRYMGIVTAYLISSSPEPLGSKGELIVYPSSRPSSVGGVCPSTIFNFSFANDN